MQLAGRSRFNLLTLLLYLLSFFIFLEWIRPLDNITSTGSLRLFALYTGVLFILAFIQLPWLLSSVIKCIGALYIIHFIFFQGSSFFALQWISFLIEDISVNLNHLTAANWDSLSNLFRTILFLVLLWLVSYLMHYWLIQARRIFLFFFVTIIYITVLDTFTPYDASSAIIRIVIMGFILLGLLRILRLQEKEGFGAAIRVPFIWILPLASLILFASLLGVAAPKAAPQWPDPVPFLKSTSNTEQQFGFEGSGVSRIGYSTNDSHLGGPFVNDETPVFTAEVSEKHYWRVETKGVYTGKGWENAAVNPQPLRGTSEALYEKNVKTESLKANIKMTGQEHFSFLVYPGQLTSVKTVQESVAFEEEMISGKINTYHNNAPAVLTQYELTYDYPQFSVEQLRQSSNFYSPEKENYLQLPETLPARVAKLANDITKEETNAYDKAKAVERYFVNNGYVYETKDVAVPGPEDDYVDQFLFETFRGYCDNFSSSMVVMLRSIGIPSRWVKGFTYGEYKGLTENKAARYEITNANAHSWVEAYFPGIGWVPFEPTRGFTNSANFTTSYEQSPDALEQKEEEPKKEEEEQLEADVKDEQPKQLISSYGKWLWMLGALLAAGVGLIVGKHYKPWIRKYMLLRCRQKSRNVDEAGIYERLLWLLRLHGIKRKPGQTLREFAVQVDGKFGTNEMKQLTKEYEKIIYENSSDPIMKDEFLELWENLIKKLQS